ncbi:MAG: aminomethyltransferase [Phycisphaerae bacterium]
MQRTPLYKFHVDAGAQMVDFAGWEMPIRYAGIIEEHKQVRTSGGLFDVSHMGRVKIHGRHARKFLERLCTRRISDMQSGQCRYSLVCNEAGGVRDDVIVYRMDEDEFLVVVNASNREKLLEHFDQVRAAADFSLKIDDQTLSTAMVALQGPKVMDLVGKVSKEIPTLKRYRFAIKNLVILKLIVSRTGYTGEDGVEVILPSGAVDMAMKLLLKDVNPKDPNAPLKPVGLGARDTLRIEAAMPLYGHELGEGISALACGVDFAISMDKHTQEKGERFIGQDALERTAAEGGPKHKLVGLEVEGRRRVGQNDVIKSGGRDVGHVTSGCLSPTLDKVIAMGFVERELTTPGTGLTVSTGRAEFAARVVPMPFYKLAKG